MLLFVETKLLSQATFKPLMPQTFIISFDDEEIAAELTGHGLPIKPSVRRTIVSMANPSDHVEVIIGRSGPDYRSDCDDAKTQTTIHRTDRTATAGPKKCLSRVLLK
jgi:hypothetical protein